MIALLEYLAVFALQILSTLCGVFFGYLAAKFYLPELSSSIRNRYLLEAALLIPIILVSVIVVGLLNFFLPEYWDKYMKYLPLGVVLGAHFRVAWHYVQSKHYGD